VRFLLRALPQVEREGGREGERERERERERDKDEGLLRIE
jgi:hypothetical protein